MTRHVFYSFDYTNDVLRASQVREIGSITPKGRIVQGNDWESAEGGGKMSIKKWIDAQMEGVDAVVVLIGEETSESSWVKYEIEQGWKKGKGVLGVYIHNLNAPGIGPSPKGKNPFSGITVNKRSPWVSALAGAGDAFTPSPKSDSARAFIGAYLNPSPAQQLRQVVSGNDAASRALAGAMGHPEPIVGREYLQGKRAGAIMSDVVENTLNLGQIVEAHDPPVNTAWGGKSAYNIIAENLEEWIENAIENRRKYA